MKGLARISAGTLLLACVWAAAAERPAPATALQFTPDGSAVVSSGYRSVRVHPASGTAPARSITCDLSQVQSLQFSPGGTTLAVGGGAAGEAGVAVLLDWPSGTHRRTLSGHRDLVTAVAYSSDGARLATGSADAGVRLWDLVVNSPLPVLTLEGHAGLVLAVAFSPDGALIVTASVDRSLKVWDAKTGKLQRSLTNHTDIIHSVSFRPPNRESPSPHPYCVTASDDRTLRIWQPGIGRMVRIVRGHQGAALTARYNGDGTRIYSAGTEGIIRAIDADSDEVLNSWKAADGWIYSLALSPDGKTLASGDWQGRVQRWDLAKVDPPRVSGAR